MINASIKKLLKKVKKARDEINIREISYKELKEMIKLNNNTIILDVRSPEEFRKSKINSAINIPVHELEKNSKKLLPNKNSLIIIYCQYGIRSRKAYEILEDNGYNNLYLLKGGIESIN